MSVTAGVSDAALEIREKLRGKIGQTKVKRYWPGKAPEWADENEDDDDLKTSSKPSRLKSSLSSVSSAFPKENDISGADVENDPRLRRLAQTRGEDRDEIRECHRRIRQAEIVEEEERERESDEEEEDEDERRRRVRERVMERRMEEERELAKGEEFEEEEEREEEEESESEYETDSEEEEDEFGRRVMAKPVFVPRKERDTILERERIEAEERAMEEAAKRRLEERKAETKMIVVEKIREDQEIMRSLENEASVEDVETDDEVNEAEEYESWKAREIGRIKREREAKEAREREREEVEKLRSMTEEERREWERKNPKVGAGGKQKQKWKFMQKYFHKGSFFQTDSDDQAGTMGSDEIYKRDFSAPTGEDKMDKSILPKVMQVRLFGRSGRTKWTHLVNEDTTDWNNPYVLFNFELYLFSDCVVV